MDHTNPCFSNSADDSDYPSSPRNVSQQCWELSLWGALSPEHAAPVHRHPPTTDTCRGLTHCFQGCGTQSACLLRIPTGLRSRTFRMGYDSSLNVVEMHHLGMFSLVRLLISSAWPLSFAQNQVGSLVPGQGSRSRQPIGFCATALGLKPGPVTGGSGWPWQVLYPL